MSFKTIQFQAGYNIKKYQNVLVNIYADNLINVLLFDELTVFIKHLVYEEGRDLKTLGRMTFRERCRQQKLSINSGKTAIWKDNSRCKLNLMAQGPSRPMLYSYSTL